MDSAFCSYEPCKGFVRVGDKSAISSSSAGGVCVFCRGDKRQSFSWPTDGSWTAAATMALAQALMVSKDSVNNAWATSSWWEERVVDDEALAEAWLLSTPV